MPKIARKIALTAEIVAAYVGNNALVPDDLPDLITGVHAALRSLPMIPARRPVEAVVKPTPAQIRQSITPSHLVSFEDGRRYKALRLHLTARLMTPDQYRAKWGLPPDYPMTSPNYSRFRSALSKRASPPGVSPARGEASVDESLSSRADEAIAVSAAAKR